MDVVEAQCGQMSQNVANIMIIISLLGVPLY